MLLRLCYHDAFGISHFARSAILFPSDLTRRKVGCVFLAEVWKWYVARAICRRRKGSRGSGSPGLRSCLSVASPPGRPPCASHSARLRLLSLCSAVGGAASLLVSFAKLSVSIVLRPSTPFSFSNEPRPRPRRRSPISSLKRNRPVRESRLRRAHRHGAA